MLPINRAEKLMSIFMLLFFSGSLNVFVSSLSLTLIRYSFSAIVLLLLIMRLKRTLDALKSAPFIVLLIALSSASFLWSEMPEITTNSIRGEILPMAIFSLYLASRFSLREQLELVVSALGISTLLSIFVVITNPAVGVHSNDVFAGAWRGVFEQKTPCQLIWL